MDKYEYRVKTEQLLEYAEKKQYQKAMEIADTIDWRRVKNASMLNTVSEVYEYCGEYQKSRDILFVAYDRAPESRKVVYRLGTLALKIGDTDEAADCYEEFVKVAPKDPNQYILKYKILKAQHSPLSEQIATLEEFKKAEYIEKWAYELAKLYHEAGMTKECLEECDDLILWFSEGKYVQMAMELKMKYKPLTPLQQEKYEGNVKGPAISERGAADKKEDEEEEDEEREDEEEDEDKKDEEEGEDKKDEEREDEEKKHKEKKGKGRKEKKKEKADTARESLGEEDTRTEDSGKTLTAAGIVEAVTSKLAQVKLKPDFMEEQEDDEHSDEDAAPLTEEEIVETVRHEKGHTQKPRSSIVKQVVTGATLEEALKSTVTLLNKEEKDMAVKDEQLRISGQMKIDDILAEWEEKQKGHAEAIKKQKEIDEERLQKERKEAQKRIEAGRLAAEEAARKAAEEAARKAAEEEAERKAAEEAARKAAEEEAARKAAEEAARKAAEEAARKAAEEETERKAAEEAARKAAEEEAERKAAEEAARKAAEEEAARKAAEEEVLRVSEESMRQEAKKKAAKGKAVKEAAKADRQFSEVSGFSDAGAGNVPTGKTQRLPDDIMALVEQLESRVTSTKTPLRQMLDGEQSEEDIEEDFEDLEEGFSVDGEHPEEEYLEEDFIEADDIEDGIEEDFEEDFEEDIEEDFEEDLEEDIEEDFEEDLKPETLEDNWEEDTEDNFIEGVGDGSSGDGLLEEDFEEEDLSEEDFEEEDFEEEDFEREALEDDFEEDFEEEDFEEEDFEEGDFEEGDFEEGDFEEDLSEEDFEEEDFEEEDFEEEDFEEEDFEEDDFEEEALSEDDFEEGIALEEALEDEQEEIPLEIEEPSEEEIQKRIKKSKSSGVPFDTGFVVTGRYDLSATSEIGLKAGLTEEQKKLFSYFVPVRGMSEQIVEVLDNDRRARREGTSRTGNILVVGRKGSGKTVLAVDIVKAIQKQRNLKQGKVAIVTGESLNKKELANIIQKLRGGAIIVEKAGKLNTRTVKELNHLMERKTGEMLFVLEDQRKPLERMLTANPEFKKKFTSKLELPVFINDELVTFGQTYAKENGYKLDEMGILALYSRIDVMQREDHAVSVAEVKDIMDEAIAHSQKANVKHLARRVFGKGTDESDRIILKEEDFRV